MNAVERVHFVEYGLIAFLFYRAAAGEATAGDPSIVDPAAAGRFMVGTLDEWLQWFIPVRVGEAHDVFLNLAAIVCGLMFALALQPPPSFTMRICARSRWRRIGVIAAVVWLVFATFVSQVHLGHAIDDRGIGRFKSHYTADELERAAGRSRRAVADAAATHAAAAVAGRSISR